MADNDLKFPKPRVGDELILFTPRARNRPEETATVRVKAVARFRVTLEGPEGEKLPWYLEEFDLRTGRAWSSRDWSQGQLHTADTLAQQQKMSAVDRYLGANDFAPYRLSSSLRRAYEADPVGFANVLRRFEGLDEI